MTKKVDKKTDNNETTVDDVAEPVQTTEPVDVVPSLSTSEKIWNEIKNKEINLFSLPSKCIADYCTPAPLDPNRCFLVAKASATLPALEEAIGGEYVCERMEKYIVISRKNRFPF
jgi:hypothetical protein